nr:reverse transcriptase domain-containing protein [Tanacetum cinerariifolium]
MILIQVEEEDTAKEVRVNIQDFYEEYYEDILPIIMEKVCRDKPKESAFDRLSETYSPSTTKSRPGRTNSRDHPRRRSRRRRLDTSNEDCPKDRERFYGVGESYDDSYSHSYHDRDRSRHMKRRRDNESPLSSVSKSDSSDGRFMHGVNNPELTKRLNEHVPKTMEEMMITTTAFIRGEVVAASKKKGHTSWRTQDQSKRQTSEKRSDFQSSPPMVTPVEKRSSNKFYDFHNDKRHSTDECMQLKKQIEELVRAGKLSHLIKEIKHGRDQSKAGKKEILANDKPAAIYMIQSWQRTTRQKVTQSFECVREITFPPLTTSSGVEGPLVIEAEMGGHMIHRMYVDGGSSMKILYEHCFNRLRPEVKNQMVPVTTSLIGFNVETIWPLGQLRLLVTIGDTDHSTRAWMNFMIVRLLSPYNGIIGRPGIREIQTVPSTAHGMLKFLVDGGIVTIRSTILITAECTTEVAIGGTLLVKRRTELCLILKKNLDIFAWQPLDMTRVLRSVAEHRLNIREGYSPVRQKKRGQALKRAKAIQAEVQKLVDAGIMTEVYYYDWLSNPVMVKKHDGIWRMCVDFTDLNKACPQDCYTLPEIDWKVESLCGYPFKCFLDAYKVEGVFLGYVVTLEGIKPCPDKTATVLQLPSPQTIKEVQSLNGKFASLNRFLYKSAEKSLPLFKTLKKCIKKSDFHWTVEVEQDFKQLKQHLSELPLLVAPKPKEELIVYLSATYEAISAVLMTEKGVIQTPIYFISRALQGPELNYTQMEKLVMSLVFAAKRLRRTSTKMKRHARRTQYHIPAKDVSKRTGPSGFSYRNAGQKSTSRASGRNSTRVMDTLHGWIVMCGWVRCWAYTDKPGWNEMGVQNVHVSVDSKLVANQVPGTYVAKEENMIKYLDKVKSLVSGFTNFSISQVPRSKNKKANALSKIESTSFAHLSKQQLVEILKEKSIKEKEVTTVVKEDGSMWMTLIMEYLKEGTLPSNRKEARKLHIKVRQYELLEGVLYRQSFLTPWLRCVGPLQAEYVIREIHEGSCSMHAGPRSVVAKAIRLGYYWPTMHWDVRDMIRTCNDCQVHCPVTKNPHQPLTPITASWPFYKWRINIAGPFPEGPGKVKCLIVAIDYFTKWIEAKAVATITGSQSNGLVERANRSLGEGIKARLGEGNKNWVEELPHVLWAHRTMIKSSHGDTPFSLAYGTEAVIPVEIGMPTYRTIAVDVVYNDEELRLNLDLLEEQHECAAIREAKTKLKMT